LEASDGKHYFVFPDQPAKRETMKRAWCRRFICQYGAGAGFDGNRDGAAAIAGFEADSAAERAECHHHSGFAGQAAGCDKSSGTSTGQAGSVVQVQVVEARVDKMRTWEFLRGLRPASRWCRGTTTTTVTTEYEITTIRSRYKISGTLRERITQ